MKNKCPDTETAACYIEGILPEKQKEELLLHLAFCKDCRERISLQQEVAKAQKAEGLAPAPDYLTESAKNLVSEQFGINVLEVIVQFTDKALEVVRTTGDLIFSSQPDLAYALRGGKKPPVASQSINKVFDNARVELEVSREQKDSNKIIMKIKDDQAETPIDDLRVTLIQGGIELESYVTQQGKAIFENVKPGRYLIQISGIDKPIGIINLELYKA